MWILVAEEDVTVVHLDGPDERFLAEFRASEAELCITVVDPDRTTEEKLLEQDASGSLRVVGKEPVSIREWDGRRRRRDIREGEKVFSAAATCH